MPYLTSQIMSVGKLWTLIQNTQQYLHIATYFILILLKASFYAFRLGKWIKSVDV
jgi:hypothetical protein